MEKKKGKIVVWDEVLVQEYECLEAICPMLLKNCSSVKIL